ncbi:MAG: hypothetical protein N3E40_01390 [Dehalococcoidia bacterium]|nr:hypothetical protein [Dehalococcoidia bacterium]
MALALSLRTPLFLGSVFGWGMMGPWMMGGFGFSPLMMLGPLVFWGLVI